MVRKLKNIRENYGKLEKEWINEKNEKKDWEDEFFRVRDIAVEKTISADRWKRNFCIMAGVWLVTALILLIVI